MRFWPAVLCVAPLAFAGTPGMAQDLPDGPGVEAVERACSGCHDLGEAVSARHDADGWRVVVDVMIGRGAAVTVREEEQIVQYLASRYGERPPEKGK